MGTYDSNNKLTEYHRSDFPRVQRVHQKIQKRCVDGTNSVEFVGPELDNFSLLDLNEILKNGFVEVVQEKLKVVESNN